MSPKTKFIYATAPSGDEALKIGRALVEERMIACVNIIDGVRSIYRWEDKIEDENEVIMVMKTVEEKVEGVIQKIKSMHSYDCPCVVALDITGGNASFLQWIAGETT